MGRIKTLLVKKTARKLLQEEEKDQKNIFTDSFEKNKKVLGKTMPSKKIRNKVAGYITRFKKKEK